jgi:hypothetical protein
LFLLKFAADNKNWQAANVKNAKIQLPECVPFPHGGRIHLNRKFPVIEHPPTNGLI